MGRWGCGVVIGLLVATGCAKKKSEPKLNQTLITAHEDVEEEYEESEDLAEMLGRRAPGPITVPTAGEYAIVAGDGALYAAPSTKAASFSRGREMLGRAFVAKVVKADADWTELQVEPADEQVAAAACVHMPDTLASLRLRMFSRTESLLYTPARRIEQDLSNDTRVGLLPGAPMYAMEGAPGRFVAGEHATKLVVTLEPADVRRSFVPLTDAGSWPGFAPREGDQLAHEWVEFETRGTTGDGAGVIFGDPAFEAPVAAAWKHGDAALIDVLGRCLAVRALVPADKIERGFSHGEGVMGRGSQHPLPAGTKLSWPDGTAAGEVARTIDLGELTPNGKGQQCATAHLDRERDPGSIPEPSAGRPIQLCIAAP